MNLGEWKAAVRAELINAGFAPGEYLGFPLVKMPETHEGRVRLLKFRTSVGSDRTIYAEGMLFLPVGSHALMKEMREAQSEEAR